MLACILGKIKALLLGSLHLLTRILCCVKKRRRSSDAGIPISTAGQPNSCDNLLNSVAEGGNWGEDDWEACEVVIDRGDPTRPPSPPRTTTDHISAYRQHMAVSRQKSEEQVVEEQDLFSDMAPTIKRQQKVFVGSREQRPEPGSRLQAVEQDPLLGLGAELGSWEEGGGVQGWEAEDADLGEALRQQKRGKR